MTNPSSSMPVRTIGIDLGDRKSNYCVLSAEGETLDEGSVLTDRNALARKFGPGEGSRAVVEASCHSRWVAQWLMHLGYEVIVANPRNVHLISKSDRKNDRNDAMLLARLGRVDPALLGPVTMRSGESAITRAMLGARSRLVETRTKLVNTVRATTKAAGARIPRCSAESFHHRARSYLPDDLRPVLEPLLDVLAGIQARIVAYDKDVDRLCADVFPETRVLRQVTGVGALIALTFVVSIDDPHRFHDSRTVGAYLGLTPRRYQSGERDPQLRISKAGDGDVRRLLVGAAAYLMRKCSPPCDLQRFGARLTRGGSKRDRARARVAVARKLAVVLHRLWLTGEVYDPDFKAKRAA